jgi:hypothetical protein
VGQQNRVGQLQELGIDLRLVLIDVEARPTDGAGGQQVGQGGFVDDLAPGGVDQDGVGLQQLQPAG